MRATKKFGFRIGMLMTLAMILAISGVSAKTQAATHTASATTDRKNGTCVYTVQGIDLETETEMTMEVKRSDNQKTALTKKIELNAENCANGLYSGVVTLQDLNYDCTSYSIHVTIGGDAIKAGVCDFSIHQSKIRMSISGGNADAVRAFQLVSGEPSGGVLVPGSGNQVSLMVWQKGKAESTAKVLGAAKEIQGSSLTWSENITPAGKAYGTWYAKFVLKNTNGKITKTLAQSQYNVEPVAGSFKTKKTTSLEKKKAFKIVLGGLKNIYGVSKVSFQIYNSKGKKIHTISASKSGSNYVATVKLKNLKYSLEKYTVKAQLTDSAKHIRTLTQTTSADERVVGGAFDINVKTDATSAFKLTGAYIPGNIKKVTFVVYDENNKKQGTYKAKASSDKKKFKAQVKSESTGKFTAYAYGYTTWGKKVLLTKKTYKIYKKNLGKQGWYYEKYAGKTYKFYYVNNEKQTDLTKILNLKKGKGKYYIEVNRAACVVNIYLYDEKTGKYDIPVRAFTVCVGLDVSTVAGAGGLNPKSYYTPIGNYSVCSNGQAVRYPLKPMHEPDGSVIYARWAVHIVGNVYFHSIAVPQQSHYALSSTKFNRLGSPASAGCIRMAVADAKWLYDYIPTGTKVKIVKGNTKKPGPLGKMKMIKSYGVNYDPTDPGVPDSRKKKDYKAKRISGYITKNGKKVGF
ncbi:MAG: L,D-transpeptidase family protein [Lachnospiraceae bacterium]|nr:L,D-transpeptidase family protein [Lachnospiraceae bacterium]